MKVSDVVIIKCVVVVLTVVCSLPAVKNRTTLMKVTIPGGGIRVQEATRTRSRVSVKNCLEINGSGSYEMN